MTERQATSLSAFLIVKDEAERLPRTLAALEGLADQIVVVDSGSTDTTVEIAKAHGAEVHHRDWTGYGAQKRFAEDQCSGAWLLNVDADEVVTPALAAEIRVALSPTPAAYRIRILNVYSGDKRPRPFANDYNVVRLYHRDTGRYRDHPLFDRVELAAGITVGQLTAPIHHFPFLNFHQLVDKLNRLSSFQAAEAAMKPKPLLLLRLITEFPLSFLRNYLFRRHIFGGWKGFAFATAAAYGRFLRVVKMLERR